MKNTTQQPLTRKWTGPIDKRGKFRSAQMGLAPVSFEFVTCLNASQHTVFSHSLPNREMPMYWQTGCLCVFSQA